MQDQATETLTTMFSEVLADLAFMFTDEDPVNMAPGGKWLETTIGYDGSHSGVLRLRCTREFAIQLAANLLGLDTEDVDTEQSARDAVKEFMNVVCGQFITAAYGTEEVFDLTIPQIVELPEAPDLRAGDETEESVLSVSGQFVQLAHLPNQVLLAAPSTGY